MVGLDPKPARYNIPDRAPNSIAVLCVADRRASRAIRTLEKAGIHVLSTYTADHAVAICVGQKIDVVVLEQALFIEVEGWSVAQSLKMVAPQICVVLVTDGDGFGDSRPTGIDAVLAKRSMSQLPGLVRKLVES